MSKESTNHSTNGGEAAAAVQNGERRKKINLTLTFDELTLLTNLASDQLFRRQFIDPKMPGYKSNTEELNLGKAVVARLRLMLD